MLSLFIFLSTRFIFFKILFNSINFFFFGFYIIFNWFIFIFNTFNNLYVLALQKSDKTPMVISKMSDLFYYIIYECNAVEVPVSKEIKLIDDYILLEELRYSNHLSVIFQKDIDSADFRIPPMLLYSFVENCFKHGSSSDLKMPWIRLLIRIRKNYLEFEASNSIPSANCVNDQITEGIGLSTIKRRLELIYPKNHQLIIRKENCTFFVRLVIQKTRTEIPEIYAWSSIICHDTDCSAFLFHSCNIQLRNES